MADQPTSPSTGKLQSDSSERDDQLARLLTHCLRIPDPREVFELLDLLREMDAIDADECAMILHLYWEGQE